MQFDHDNKIVQLCAKGIMTEGEGKIPEARQLYDQAWDMAQTDFEKFVAAHYLARNQPDINENLKWNEIALQHALAVNEESVAMCYPSLYLNIGKSYEDMVNIDEALKNYLLAKRYTDKLTDDGYSNMIRAGIEAGLQRVQKLTTF
jgi:rifampin ADP-ribosylating transferase